MTFSPPPKDPRKEEAARVWSEGAWEEPGESVCRDSGDSLTLGPAPPSASASGLAASRAQCFGTLVMPS